MIAFSDLKITSQTPRIRSLRLLFPAFICAACWMTFSPASASASIVVSVIPYSPTSGWQTVYSAYSTQESFESLPLVSNLSITLSGNVFTTPETHSSLPALFNPAAAPGGAFGGPFNNNVWDGTNMATNWGYDGSQPIGNRWLNACSPTVNDQAMQMRFNIGGAGALAFGIGMSNFQSLTDPSFPVTNHDLIINGVSYGTIESLGGANFTTGYDTRNGYLSLVATPDTPITSVAFDSISLPDGLTFDALGFNAAPVPEPTSMVLAGAAGLFGLVARRARAKRKTEQ